VPCNGSPFLQASVSPRNSISTCPVTAHEAARQCLRERAGKPARVFTGFKDLTKKSWSRARRMVAKAEPLEDNENPRYPAIWLPRLANWRGPRINFMSDSIAHGARWRIASRSS
jgi:hypothetical protein